MKRLDRLEVTLAWAQQPASDFNKSEVNMLCDTGSLASIAAACAAWQLCPISAMPEYEVRLNWEGCLTSKCGMVGGVRCADEEL